jgi:acyl CoA:acetate/3-ketoacid CoA transferase beta subunit
MSDTAKGQDGGTRLVDIAPGVTREEIRDTTEAPFTVAEGRKVAA